MALKLNGKPLDLSPKSPATDALRAWLDKAPQDEVFTGDVLSEKVKICRTSSLGRAKDLLGDKYTLVIRGTRYWGHPKAIQALRKQVSA